MNSENFDAEKFINDGCPCGCGREGRKAILEGIESLKDSNPVLSKQLSYYLNVLMKKDKEQNTYHQLCVSLGNDVVDKKAAEALRAMADKIEAQGMHFMIYCKLPELPIFSGENDVKAYSSSITVTMVRGPLGG